MKKKILTFIAAMVLLMLTPMSVLYASAETTAQAFDTVMVLDISGSMSSEMSDMKTSAIDFCTDILGANPNNKIAIVSFESDAYIECDLTNDLNTLTTAINNLSSTGGTNMTAGCQLAYNIITGSSSTNKIKNVIIMADGCPGTGEYMYDGRYNSMFPSLDVEYENKVYDYVSTNLHPIASVYSVGFFGDIDPDQAASYDDYTQLAIQLMKDLANTSSYFPTSADSMFNDVADNIISGNNSGDGITVPPSSSSTTMIIIGVSAATGGVGLIALIIFLATRKPPVPPAPIMAPVFLPIVDDDDDDDNNNNKNNNHYHNNAAPAGIERFAADAGAVRNDGYYSIPNVERVPVYGISGTYRNVNLEMSDGELINVGRDPATSNLIITEDNTKVSRVHCTISYNAVERCFVVTDLSKNGTFTKSTKLPYNVPTNVSCGSEIQLADSSNIFRLG